MKPFIRFLTFLLLLAVQLASATAHAAPDPEASGGMLDLRDWDFAQGAAVILKGEWQFAPDRLVGPREPWPADAVIRRAPGALKDAKQFAYGAGTYRLRIDCSTDRLLAMAVPFEPTAMTLFVNGREFAQQGWPGLDRETHLPGVNRQVVTLPGVRCPMDVRVQVSNFELYRGGMVRALTLGTPEQLHAQRESDVARNVVAVSAAMVVGIFGLFSFVAWRRDASGVVLGLFCVSLASYLAFSADGAFRSWLGTMSFEGWQRLWFANSFLLWAMHPPLVHTLFPRQSRRETAAGLAAFCATGFVVALVAPLEVFARSGPLSWFAWFAVVSYFVFVQIRASLHGERAARITLAAVLVLLGTVAHDLLAPSNIYLGNLLPYGLTAVVVALALLLAERFGRALAAEELRSAEQGHRVDLLVRATKAGVLDREMATGVLRASDRYREMLGLPLAGDATELPPLASLIHPEDRAEVLRLLESQEGARGTSGLRRWDPSEFRMLRADGSAIWVHLEAVSLCGEDGRALRHIYTFIDISQLKSAQQRLRQAQSALVTEARRAGMAQIATNVLHNVGNVLTSVNVSAHVLAGRLEGSRAARLVDVANLLEGELDRMRPIPCGDKLQLLPGYVRGLATELESERDDLLAEVKRLSSSVDHIKNVVAMQQSYAGASGVRENMLVTTLVDDALELQLDTLASSQVTVQREFGQTAAVPLDRTRIMQILVNLIDNAREAMTSVQGARVLRITVQQDAEAITLTVTDNGCGIDPGDMKKMFSHGFTTRPEGHGFGLHSCAVAAREMGGELSVRSDGPGKGATFILRLPADAA